MSQILVAFSQEEIARLLVNYLQSQQIHVEYLYQQDQHQHGVQLIDFADEGRAAAITQEFLLNPQDAKYQQAAWHSVKPCCNKRHLLGAKYTAHVRQR